MAETPDNDTQEISNLSWLRRSEQVTATMVSLSALAVIGALPPILAELRSLVTAEFSLPSFSVFAEFLQPVSITLAAEFGRFALRSVASPRRFHPSSRHSPEAAARYRIIVTAAEGYQSSAAAGRGCAGVAAQNSTTRRRIWEDIPSTHRWRRRSRVCRRQSRR